MAGQHSIFPPSAMDIIAHCGGSVRLSEPYLDAPDTPEAAEGTAAHWVAFEIAQNMNQVAAGTIAPNGVMVDDDMIEGAELWANVIRKNFSIVQYAETPIAIPRIHSQCWGTPDYFTYNPVLRKLRVIDYKYGHMYVEVFENLQLTAYTAGILDYIGLDDQATEVEFIIVQPRCFHPEGTVRRWSTMAYNLRGLINQMSYRCEMALRDDVQCATGTHCQFCLGRIDCKTLLMTADSIADFVGTAERFNMGPLEIGRELRILDDADNRLQSRRTALQAQALAFLQQGKAVPFYHIEHTKPRRRWKAPVEDVVTLGEVLGIELRKPDVALITPTQAIARGIDEAVITEYADYPPGSPKLAADNSTNYRKVFSNGNTEN